MHDDMRYWHIKEHYMQGGMSDFYGVRERIYRGKDEPEEFLSKYTDLIPTEEERIAGMHKGNFCDRCRKLAADKNFDPNLYYTKDWKIDWKKLSDSKYYYPHEVEVMIEITEEKMKKIIGEE